MAPNIIPNETADFTGGVASGDSIKTPLAADSSSSRKIRRQVENAYMLGMTFTFSFATCVYVPFIVNFEHNSTYLFLAAGALASLAFVAACLTRVLTILSHSLHRENLFCRSIGSYQRQLNKANSRAEAAQQQTNRVLRIEGLRRRGVAGEADGDMGNGSPSASREILHKGTIQ